jgi:predicted regulator of Ras-like GTPase activity (Roadblock/LC7/MglB family)
VSGPIVSALDRLSRVPGVRGALVVDLQAGVPVATELAAEMDEGAISALAASLLTRAGKASADAGFGTLESLQLQAGEAVVLMAAAGELALVALADPAAQLGLVRLEVLRSARELS